MYEKVLVSLDGTHQAEQALAPAVSLARSSGADICLATVELPTPIDLPELPYQASVGEVQADYLDAVAGRVREAGAGEVTTKVLKGTDVAEVLEGFRNEIGAGLTVMSTHGRGPARRAWIGSVADRMVRSSAAPVLLVRSADEAEAPDLSRDVAFARVMVTLDGSELSEAAIEPARQLAGPEASYLLARVIETPHELTNFWLPVAVEHTEEQLEDARSEAEAELGPVVERVRGEGLSVQGVAKFREPAAHGILELAEEHGADLIAIATHGRGGLARAMLGSIADKVIRGAECPVLVVRPASS